MMYYGAYAREKEDLEAAEDDFIYIGYNFHWENRKPCSAQSPEGMCWKKNRRYLSSWNRILSGGEEEYKKSIEIGPRAIVVLLGRQEAEKDAIMAPWLHFRTITKHKLLVMKYCFRIGLYKQGLLHDLSKYSPTEFLVGCKYYQGQEVLITQNVRQPAYPCLAAP